MEWIWAEKALTADGWVSSLALAIGPDGRIAEMKAGAEPKGRRVGVLLPAPANLHSHAFQRAIAGLTERRGPDPRDTFWTWRKLMYRFLDHLTPEDVGAITSFAQMEMLEAGYACVAEFHYLHHQPNGAAYEHLAELSNRIVAAAKETGIGLTLLPVFYERGGCDGRALEGPQLRFGNTSKRFAKLWESARGVVETSSGDARIGVAAHSLRAVGPESLAECHRLAAGSPMHIHIAEQTGEVDEVEAAYGARPVEWLLGNHDVNAQWCLVHATQMEPKETKALAKSGAVAGLCPVTEANLGDGVFDGVRYFENGGRFGVGTDSNIRISLAEELRLLEYSQRLQERSRAVLATSSASTGRILFEGAARGGAQAAGRDAGVIEPGRYADLLALDGDAADFWAADEDAILDAFIFATADRAVTDVWAGGRHVVQEGRHIRRDAIESRYRTALAGLRTRL